MKKLIFALFVILNTNLYAHDTSGCLMIESSKSIKTTFGNSLLVKSTQVSNNSCWNVQNNSVTITYRWVQDSDNESQDVKIWANINGNTKTLITQITCTELRSESISYSKDTTNNDAFLCSATATVKTGFLENVSLELAPMINGSWDTGGYAQNYSFEF
jgi:hypothetical protein